MDVDAYYKRRGRQPEDEKILRCIACATGHERMPGEGTRQAKPDLSRQCKNERLAKLSRKKECVYREHA
ncbi:MAG: hypothetical protein ACYDHX_13905 [Methanothrix sp.]